MPYENKHILVAEDDMINQELVRAFLNMKGVENVTIVENGEKAVNEIKKGGYDLVFMDINMPVMGGVEATKAIREIEHSLRVEHVPVIALSASIFDEDKITYIQAGMNDTMQKPIDSDLLDSVLDTYLNNKAEILQCAYNIEDAVDALGMPKAFIEKLLIKFQEGIEAELEELQTAISQNNYEKVHEISHKLKGRCANLHIHFMTTAFSKMEIRSKQKDLKGLESYIRKLKAYATTLG